MSSKLGFSGLTVFKSVILASCIFLTVFYVGAQESNGLDMNVQPEDPKVGDNIIVEVFMNGEPLEDAEVVSRNNVIGETDENGVLLFTAGDSGELVLTVEKNGDWVQRDLEVEGAQVSESSNSEALEQPVTGQFISSPGNIYSFGFILGVLAGLAALIKYRVGFDNLKGVFNL